MNTTIEKAIDLCGSAAVLAEACGVSIQLVSFWKNNRRSVSAEACVGIERATKGAVTCEELRPDLTEHWAYLRGTRCVCNPVQDNQEAA